LPSGRSLAQRLWRELVPVAFHVDYWDRIGWPDRFASADYSSRQRHYAERGRIGSVYTPGFVVAGREWRGWFGGRPLHADEADPVGVLAVSIDGDTVSANFEPPPGRRASYVLHVARLGFGLETAVAAGENRGATLRHDFVVLGYRSRPLPENGDGSWLAMTLPQASQPAARQGVAAWVTETGSPVPIQATGGWLQR